MQAVKRQQKAASSQAAAAAGRRAGLGPDTARPGLLSFQRTPSLTLQPKLSIGQPGDKFEQEADRVAEKVVSQPQPRTPVLQPPPSKKFQPRRPTAITPLIQQQNDEANREEAPLQEEDQTIQGRALQLQQNAMGESEEGPASVQMHAPSTGAHPGNLPAAQLRRNRRPWRPTGRTPPVLTRFKGGMTARAPPMQLKSTAVHTGSSQPAASPRPSRVAAQGESLLTPFREKGEVRPQWIQCRAPPVLARTEASESRLDRELRQSRGGGLPLPEKTRIQMEAAIGADFQNVRVHTDAGADAMNRMLGSQAFATGSAIYFGAGRYDPETFEGQRLLAHELTHTVQQSASPPKTYNPAASPRAPPIQQSAPNLQGGFIGDRLNEYARHVPGWELFTVIIGYNPLTEQDVERTPQNLLRGFMGLVPGGTALYDKLNENGLIDGAFGWLQTQLSELDLSWSRLRNAIDAAWEEMDFIRWDPFEYNLRVLKRHLLPIWNDVKTFAGRVIDKTVELVRTTLLTPLVDFIKERTRAYPLLTVILGEDPVTGEPVARSLYNIVSAFLMLTESGEAYLNKLNESGKLRELSDWLDAEIEKLDVSAETVTHAFSEAWELLDLNAVLHPIDTFTRLYNIFAGPVTRLFNFVVAVAMKVLGLIKDWLIGLLKQYADDIPGYPLLRVILGRDPLTGEDVPRTAENFIMGFLSFVPGGREKFRNLQESGAIDRAFSWLEEAIGRLGLIGEALLNAFTRIWETFTINDLLNPIAAFERVVAIFTEPVRMIIDFALEVGMKILEFIFEGVLGPMGARVLAILKRARSTFLKIIKDPIAFVGHLIDAVKKGFRQFAGNILRHLQAGLIGWLTGTLGPAGITLPERFDFKGILSLVLQVLGITWQRVRQKLVRHLGERAVSFLETGFEVVRILVTEGPSGLWEHLKQHLSNLKDTVIDGIKNFIITRIVTAAVTRIATMLNPAGAVIQAIIAIYNTIMFFIERINQIIALVEAVVNSIANIAAGKIDDAANYVEQSMARTIPVIISFLARLIGLGNLTSTIQNILRRVQRVVDRAIDRVIGWIVRQARRLIRAGRGAVASVAGWFRRRVPFQSSDGRRHSLYFEGTDRNPQLKVRSIPTSIQTIIDTKMFNDRRINNRTISRLRNVYNQLKNETRKGNRGGTVNENIIQRCLNDIKRILGQDSESDMHHPKGDQGDPVLVNWYKRESDYPRIFGASPTTGFRRTVQLANGQERIITRGIAARNFPQVGSKIMRTGSEGRTTREFFTNAELNALSRAAGMSGPQPSRTAGGNRALPEQVGRQNITGSPQPGSVQSVSGGVRNIGRPTETVFQVDHIRDLRLGGEDILENLWPLRSSLNNTLGAMARNQEVVTGLESGRVKKKKLSNAMFLGKRVKAKGLDVNQVQARAETALRVDGHTFDGGQNPYWIAWPKQARHYPSFTPPGSTSPVSIGGQATIGRYTFGVNPEFYRPTQPWVIRNNTNNRGTANRLRNELTALYRTARTQGGPAPRVRERGGGELESLDLRTFLEIDHVLDLNFGGSDPTTLAAKNTRSGNLWPLAANKNNAANAINNQYVAIEGEEEGISLRSVRKSNLWVKVVQLLGIPSGQGSHGTSKTNPAGRAELLRISGAQTKTWGRCPSDHSEQEADRVADCVAFNNRNRASTLVDRISSRTVHPKSQMKQQEGKTENARAGLYLPHNGGVPMGRGVREEMESSFGRNFSEVRIHNDSKSYEMSNSIGARAFTKGSDIYFARGEYNPSTTSGKHLLAHELTHTIQQGSVIRRQPAESVIVTPPSPVTRTPDSGSFKLGGAPMPGLEPPIEEEIMSPAQVEEMAGVEVGFKKDKKAQGPGEKGEPKGVKEKKKPTTTRKEEKPDRKKSPEKKSKGKAAPAPKPLKSGSSNGMLNDFMTSPASRIAASYPFLGKGVSDTLKAEKKRESDSAPNLVAKAGKGAMSARPPPKEAKGAGEAAIEEKTLMPVSPQKAAGHKDLAKPVNNARNNKALDQSPSGGWLSWFRDRVSSFMSAVRTRDEGVNTRAGKPPRAELTGEADPERAESQRQDGDRQTGAEKNKVAARIKANPGKQRIQPAPVKEVNAVKIEATELQVETGQQDDMADYINLPLPGNVRKRADEGMAPLLAKSLAKPREEVKKAALKRKTDKQAEVARAKAEVDNLNRKADQDQQNIVDTSRNDVAAEQKKGLDEAGRQVRKYRQEADKEQTSLKSKVKKRVKEDEGKAAAKLKKAEQDAEKEKQKKEAEAAAKKRELKRQQKKKSWWDRVVDAVKSAVKALTKAIDGIFNALRKAVKFIIDTAKKAALAVIELGRKFVVGLLNTFRKFLKSLVTNLIGKVFPELAKKINQAIDKVVDKAIAGVNKVAGALKKGVEALANALGKALDKILSVFQTALKAAVQIAGAVLTGDFAEAAKIAFYAACDILGINPKSVINFMEKAGESLGKIFKSPSTFFNNVVRGVKKGIDQFVAKIKQHLLNGLIAWLTGAMGDIQITLPEKFDIKGIFSLVTQILGLTYANIRAKVVKRLGPKGEQIVSTLEETFALVKDLVTKGPIALWERVKQSLSNLKDRIMEGIRNVVIEKVVKAGVVWLISMLNPASALAKAIKMLYDLVMFFVERWDQIVAFAQSIWNSVNALANGRIGAAANAVEQALARSVPVILSLLASLLGLGGIGKSVQKFIRKLRKPIDAALDKVITFIVKQGRKLLNKITGKAGGGKPREKQTPAERTKNKRACEKEIRRVLTRGTTFGRLKAMLPKLKEKYKVREIRMDADFDVKVINSDPAEIKVTVAHEIGLDKEGKLVEAKPVKTGKRGEPGYDRPKPKEEFTFGTINSSSDHPPTLKAVLEKELKKHQLSLEEIEYNRYFSGFPAAAARPSRVSGTIYGYIAGKVGAKARTGTSAIVGKLGNREASFRQGSFRGGEGGYDGGHLIGHSFGGPDAYYNLVPMKARVNRQVYGGIEKFMRNQVRVDRSTLPLDKKKSNLDISVAMNYGSGAYTINMGQFLKAAAAGLKSEKARLRQQKEENRAKRLKLEEIKKGLPADTKKAAAELNRYRRQRESKKSELKKRRQTEERDLLVWNLTQGSGLKKASALLERKKQARAQVNQAEKILGPLAKLIADLKAAAPATALIGALASRHRVMNRLIAEYGKTFADQPGSQADRRLSLQGLLLRAHIRGLQKPRDLTRSLEKELARTPTLPDSDKEIDAKIKAYDEKIRQAVRELARTDQAGKLKSLEDKGFSGAGSVSVHSRIPAAFTVDLEYEAVAGKGGGPMVKADSKGARKAFSEADLKPPPGASKAGYGTLTVSTAKPDTKLILEDKAPSSERSKPTVKPEEEKKEKAAGQSKPMERFRSSFTITQA